MRRSPAWIAPKQHGTACPHVSPPQFATCPDYPKNRPKQLVQKLLACHVALAVGRLHLFAPPLAPLA